MMVLLLTSIALLGVGLLVYLIEPLAVLGIFERLAPNVIFRIPTHRPLVALSFDDGPHPIYTPQVLEILERYDANATFFLIGECAQRHPDVVARIKAAGHEVGNHYVTNGSTLGHSDDEFLAHLDQTERDIHITTVPKLFRPPGGVAWPRQLRLARNRGYECVLGCAYPHDPIHPPVWYIRWLIEKNLVPGAIVILHDGISNPTRSIQALPHILTAGRERKLRFVTIGELGSRGHPRNPVDG
jgi:peptidoglycan/xylan/chitin deacetylase (PgdA/CDA1 family)